MKKMFCLLANFSLSVSAFAAVENYTVDKNHSKISFEVPHMGISSVSGSFKDFSGEFKFDPKDFSKSTLHAEALAASIDTGVSQRDAHLRSSDFFDAEKYPKIIFHSTSAVKINEKEFDLIGDLTMRGITKNNVKFHVTYSGGITTKEGTMQSFKAQTDVNRQDFKMNFQKLVEKINVVGDNVHIEIKCEGLTKKV